MKVSIITVVYNNKEFITDCIDSVLSQTFQDIEYIIIDGGSTDGTLDIVNKYRNRIAHFISEKDNGLYDAMNKGVKIATGSIIGFLNSDDIFMNDSVIQRIVDKFEDDQELDIVYGDLVYVRQNNTNQIVRKWNSKKYYDRFFEHANVPPHPSVYIKKSVYRSVDLFNLNFKLAADYEFMFRVFKKHHLKIDHLNLIIVKMRLGGVTSKNWENRIIQNKEIKQAWITNGFKPPFYFFPLRFFKKIIQYI